MSGSNDQQGNPYAPPGPPPIVFEGYTTLNTESARPSIKDDQCSWLDGWMPIGESTARTMYDVSAAIFSLASGTIVWFGTGNVESVPYIIAFISDGSIVAINLFTNAASQIAPAGTIANPSQQFVGMTTWGNLYIIIVSDQTNGYFVWDGTTFYFPGDTVPGIGVVPSGLKGTYAEIYQSRVWIAAPNAVITFSAPGSLVDFATGDGGGSVQLVDNTLRRVIVALVQTSGFLYVMGDSSISYISGVTTSGTPPTTTFSVQNADPEIGVGNYSAAVDVFSRNIIFANPFGVHVSYGGQVQKISDMLDGIYNSVPNFGGQFLSAAKAIVFGKRIWALLLPIIDPITGQQENELFCWDGKRWWCTGQSPNLTFVQHSEYNSALNAYGTDGTDIYQLFATPSTALTKIIQSKLFATPGGLAFLKSADRIWGAVYLYDASPTTLSITIDNETGVPSTNIIVPASGGVPWINITPVVVHWINNIGQDVTWVGKGNNLVVFQPTATAQNGAYIGLTISTTCADMALLTVSISPQIAGYRG